MQKELIQFTDKKIFESPYIKEIIDLSDDFTEAKKFAKELGGGILDNMFDSLNMARMRIVFKNDFQLSVIRGQRSHGGEQGLFEIMIINPLGSKEYSLFDESDQGGEVLGYCSIERVRYYIDKIGKIQNTKLNQQ